MQKRIRRRTELIYEESMEIYCDNDEYLDEAGALGRHLGARVLQGRADSGDRLTLQFDSEGLSLSGNGQVMRGDLTRMLPRIRTENVLRSELLVKAARIKDKTGQLTAADATAGLGEDALLLAAAGFSVELYERDPVIAALLKDALKRAAAVPGLEAAAARMRLHEEDSLMALLQLDGPPDVVLLDPMFPGRQKSALIKKKFQLLQQLEQPCTDEDELLKAAIMARPQKVIIKRPLKGPYLAGRRPDYSISGKTIRYDCICLMPDSRPLPCL